MPPKNTARRLCCTPQIKRHLSGRDKRLGAFIEKTGVLGHEVSGDAFTALLRSIVGQQISSKAAQTVWERLEKFWGRKPGPKKILALDPLEIQRCGLSHKKVGYLRGVAQAALEKRVAFSKLHELPDAEVIAQLSSLKGVGVWTAEMILMFTLGHPDVVSFGDFGIRRGFMRLYGKKEITKKDFERYRKRYSPHGSVASLYIWAAADQTDPIPVSSKSKAKRPSTASRTQRR